MRHDNELTAYVGGIMFAACIYNGRTGRTDVVHFDFKPCEQIIKFGVSVRVFAGVVGVYGCACGFVYGMLWVQKHRSFGNNRSFCDKTKLQLSKLQ